MSNAIVKLYGSVFDWNVNGSQDFMARLDAAAQSSDLIELHIHSYGGSVIEGNMIINAIKKCKKPVHAYIDGIAASMAAIIAISCDKVFMSENAMEMIHAPAGSPSGRGTLKDYQGSIKALIAFEKNFVKMLIARTGKDEAYVRGWLDTDTWFSAEDALAEGLIDGIVDPIAKSVEFPTQSATMIDVEVAYNLYTAELQIENTQPILKQNNQMDKEKLIKTLGLTGVTAESSDVDIETAIEAKEKANKEALEKAQSEVKAQADARVAAAIEPYKDKLTIDQRKHFEAIGKQCGVDVLNSALAPFASHRTITEALATGGKGAPTTNSTWSFDQWQENDPRGLEKLALEDYDAFNALYRAKFGADAPR